jgi:hypothetical protein
MLNHPDYFITSLTFPYGDETGWAVRVAFTNRKSGKKTTSVFEGERDWKRVAAQTNGQLKTREYVSVSNEPKPKHAPKPEPTPIKGKGKGKK